PCLKQERALSNHEPSIVRILDESHQGRWVNWLHRLQLAAQVNVLAEVLLCNRCAFSWQHQHVVAVLWDLAIFEGQHRWVNTELRNVFFSHAWADWHNGADIFAPDIKRCQRSTVQPDFIDFLDAGFEVSRDSGLSTGGVEGNQAHEHD